MIADDDTELHIVFPPFFMLSSYFMAKDKFGDYIWHILLH